VTTTAPVNVRDDAAPQCPQCGVLDCPDRFDHEREFRGSEATWWREARRPANWGWDGSGSAEEVLTGLPEAGR
jgi:hypothetical protein